MYHVMCAYKYVIYILSDVTGFTITFMNIITLCSRIADIFKQLVKKLDCASCSYKEKLTETQKDSNIYDI